MTDVKSNQGKCDDSDTKLPTELENLQITTKQEMDQAPDGPRSYYFLGHQFPKYCFDEIMEKLQSRIDLTSSMFYQLDHGNNLFVVKYFEIPDLSEGMVD